METYKENIEKETVDNTDYRRVVFTGDKMQLVLMSLKPNEEIPKEVHHEIEQFIRIESGKATAYVAGKEYNLEDDDCIIIPAETEHQIVNASDSEELKLYSIYASPEHPKGTIHKTKAEADAAEHHH
jgi:mannose-6-phosphate isomerase-like protein (cupin superfamily)